MMAVAMSGGVYTWLKAKVPTAQVKCPEGVSLEITSIDLHTVKANISMDIRNRGLFAVNGIVIRVNEGRKSCRVRGIGCANCTRYVFGQDRVMFIQKLGPQETRNVAVQYFSGTHGCPAPTQVEIVPLRVVEDDVGEQTLSICENAIFKENI
jgi:hypothetical protein